VKTKVKFFCTECGQESLKWVGKCPGCEEWNTMVEEPVGQSRTSLHRRSPIAPAVLLQTVKPLLVPRITSGSEELDRVMGGGIVPGSVVLVGGDPGIGKSTLLLQTAEAVAARGIRVLYVSGEESLEQIRLRADRLQSQAGELYVAAETDLNVIIEQSQSLAPGLLIVDSIQTAHSPQLSAAPGSVGQIRECTARLTRLAKEAGIATFLIGHVTKEGSIAGPRVLEHMVDVVLYFEGERHLYFRLLRAVKNRFGSTNEVGVFQMNSEGLKDVANPSEYLITERSKEVAGSVVVPLMEGTRPMLVEVQGLVAPASFGNPRRATTGIDGSRVAMILAVLEKRVGYELSFQDSYVNVVGGIRVNDPAADLAVAVSLASSYRNTKLPQDLAVIGEIGLTGEVRGVGRVEARALEARKLGFNRIILPGSNLRELKDRVAEVRLVGVSSVQEALQAAWNI
jgi:DNA repair protein RadA/Sms